VTDPGDLAAENLVSGKGYRPIAERGELDRWIISELNQTLASVVEKMDAYDNYGAAGAINQFVDVLSNWYVRRSRDRFWAGDRDSPEKLDAYWTLFECLTTTAKMVAPFVPFVSEVMWRNLTSTFGEKTPPSVHLCDYPTADSGRIDSDLSRRMSLLREVASLGLSARANAKLKVRQPLSGVTVILKDTTDQPWLAEHDELLKTELNVQDVTYTTDAGEYVSYSVVPNFKRLGPRVGKLMPHVKKAFGDADAAKMMAELSDSGATSIEVAGETISLDNEDIEVRLAAKEGWAAAQGTGVVVVLATELTPELVRAGYSRDLVRFVQDRRKELDLERTDRINVVVATDSDELEQAIEENKDYITGETLAVSLEVVPLASATADAIEKEIGDHNFMLFVTKAQG
jgi:isoleucyl-tRNA synthetase